MTLRFGLLSTGNIARQFAAGLATARRARVVAVASRSQASADAFAARFGVSRVFGSYEALLACDEVDAVYNALPNSMHHEWTIRALRAGKHVLCEKPLAVTPAEGEAMFAAARAAGRALVEAFMYRSHPQTRAVTAAVGRGEIGRLRVIRASFCYRARTVDGNIRFDAGLAGGAIMDIGCYCVDLGRLLAGAAPSGVAAWAQLHPSGVDEAAAGVLRYPGEALLSFACGMSVQADNTAMICGDEGYIEVPVPWKPPARGAVWSIRHSTPPRQDGGGDAPPRRDFAVDAPAELYALEADDFAATALDGAPPAISAVESLDNLRVLQELRRQAGLAF